MQPHSSLSRPTLPEDLKADLLEVPPKAMPADLMGNLEGVLERKVSSFLQVGSLFGKLKVLEFLPLQQGVRRKALCLCECGELSEVATHNLLRGGTQSCGCLRAANSRRLRTTHNQAVPGARTKLYRTWVGMKNRCYNKKAKDFPSYGGRGITVCSTWLGNQGFETFAKNMGEPPSNVHSIDRVDNYLGYSSNNCRWASKSEQSLNRRSVVLVTLGQTTLPLGKWDVKLGFCSGSLARRLRSARKKNPEITATQIVQFAHSEYQQSKIQKKNETQIISQSPQH